MIDRVLPDCKSYEDFLARMRAEGDEIKEGKNLHDMTLEEMDAIWNEAKKLEK